MNYRLKLRIYSYNMGIPVIVFKVPHLRVKLCI